MLELAESLTKGSGDGRISKDDATKLWEDAMDGQGLTDCERRTIQYVYDTFNCTDAAKTVFASLLGIEDATAMEVVETDTTAEAAAAAAAAKGDADAADDWPSGSLVWHKNPNGRWWPAKVVSQMVCAPSGTL